LTTTEDIAEKYPHIPVLTREVLELLHPAPGERFLDGTVGCGGHAEALLRSTADIELLGIDRDEDAIKIATARLEGFGSRVKIWQACFSEMQECADDLGWTEFDGVLLDLGMSSLQLDRAERGFALRKDGPLDMRMDRRLKRTAAAILNEADEDTLVRIFKEFGEERSGRRIAKAVLDRRTVEPFERTLDFADLVEKVVGRYANRGLPAATKCFQGLRIAVNSELDELADGLEVAIDLLRPGGRLAVISFHSLEDRQVKQFFKQQEAGCVCPPKIPKCICGRKPSLKIVTKRPVQAQDDELAVNRRAASAKLRVAEKI
jgi:16S rRNA (cytosine1402-N4)-methyltransferase